MPPTYMLDIVNQLRVKYPVEYTIEESGDMVLDCLNIGGYMIKIDRLPVDTLSAEDTQSLITGIVNLLKNLLNRHKELGWIKWSPEEK